MYYSGGWMIVKFFLCGRRADFDLLLCARSQAAGALGDAAQAKISL
jgi:hypothetical protein